MRVTLIQTDPIIGDFTRNTRMILEGYALARRERAEVAVSGELAVCGYPPRDLLERADFLDACAAAAAAVVAGTADGGPVLVFGAPWRADGRLHNAAVVAHDGRVVAVVPKSLLPTYDVFDERRYFSPGHNPGVIAVAGLRLGVTVCEDLWNDPELTPDRRYDLDPVLRLVGADLVVNLSASPFHAGKVRLRRSLLARVAARVGAPVVYVNQVGGNDELLFDGRSFAVGADGRLLGEAAACAADTRTVDTDGVAAGAPLVTFEEEVHDALVMGLRDYAARCGFRRALVGLSGGIDSALVAVLAARALGPANVLGVGLPGPYSSEGSVTDARRLAANLGIRFELLPIIPIVDAFLHALDNGPLAGHPRDVTEENLQARTRGTLLMAISNKLGHLLLTTGNKSEMAVGYCTLYGDMNGGLAVVADLFKTEVYRLSRWINRDGEVIPQATLDKAPSAELAPNQTDQDSLPPYDVLDAILRAYVEGCVSPDAIVALGHDRALVERVVRLVVQSEYKRWQAPPALRVSPRAFGTGRRLPLAQKWR
jgi:NAD+ synthetase